MHKVWEPFIILTLKKVCFPTLEQLTHRIFWVIKAHP